MKKIVSLLLVLTLLFSIPLFASESSESEVIKLTEGQKILMRAYGLTEDEINNITSEKIRNTIQNGYIKNFDEINKIFEKNRAINNFKLTEELKKKIKDKGLNDAQTQALIHMSYTPEEIASMDNKKIIELLSDTETPFGSSSSIAITATYPPPNFNEATVPDTGEVAYFHPNVPVSPANMQFYVDAARYSAEYMFQDSDYSHLNTSYYLWGEAYGPAHPTWCHEGVDLQNTYYTTCSVRSCAPGTIKYVDRNNYGAIMVYNSTLGVTYNYQHMTNIPATFVTGTWITLGQNIGKQGNVGAEGGKHLHVGVCNDNPTGCSTLHSGKNLDLICCSPYGSLLYFWF